MQSRSRTQVPLPKISLGNHLDVRYNNSLRKERQFLAQRIMISSAKNHDFKRKGNILSLQRNGEQDSASSVILIDDLVYTYDDGNKLKKVQDRVVNPSGYNDGDTALRDDYLYDLYGNLILDSKGIAGIFYDHLNLPITIDFTNTGNHRTTP